MCLHIDYFHLLYYCRLHCTEESKSQVVMKLLEHYDDSRLNEANHALTHVVMMTEGSCLRGDAPLITSV